MTPRVPGAGVAGTGEGRAPPAASRALPRAVRAGGRAPHATRMPRIDLDLAWDLDAHLQTDASVYVLYYSTRTNAYACVPSVPRRVPYKCRELK
jgi:hypothetical protein